MVKEGEQRVVDLLRSTNDDDNNDLAQRRRSGNQPEEGLDEGNSDLEIPESVAFPFGDGNITPPETDAASQTSDDVRLISNTSQRIQSSKDTPWYRKTDVLLALVILFPILIFLPSLGFAKAGFNWFSVHIFFGCCFVGCCVIGIFLRQKPNPAWTLYYSNLHIRLQFIALASITVTFICMITDKILANDRHFNDAHSICALCTLILMCGVGGFGSLLKYRPALVGGAMKARRLFVFHRASGYLAAIAALLTLGLAMLTDFAEEFLVSGVRAVIFLLMGATAVVLIAGGERKPLFGKRTSTNALPAPLAIPV